MGYGPRLRSTTSGRCNRTVIFSAPQSNRRRLVSYRTNSPQRVLQLHQAANAQARLSSSKRTLVLEQGWQPEKAMHRPFSDRFARATDDVFSLHRRPLFAKRYGHRAVVLETIAGVPARMVAGMDSFEEPQADADRLRADDPRIALRGRERTYAPHVLY